MIVLKECVKAFAYHETCNNYGGESCPDDVCGFDTPSGTCNCDNDKWW